ncbi:MULTISPECIES: hypothetical protein [Borreliella]|nr:hypothetical protein [Borreliella bavariensis]
MPLKLRDARWICSSCSTLHDRDIKCSRVKF